MRIHIAACGTHPFSQRTEIFDTLSNAGGSFLFVWGSQVSGMLVP